MINEPIRPRLLHSVGATVVAGLLIMTPGCRNDSPPPAPVPSAPAAPTQAGSVQPTSAATASSSPATPASTSPSSHPTTTATTKPTGNPTNHGGRTTKVDFVTALARNWPARAKAGSKITEHVEVSGDPVEVLVRLKGTCYADKTRYPDADFYLEWHGKWSHKITPGTVPHPAVITVSAKVPKQCGSALPGSGGPEIADASTKESFGLDAHDITIYR